jgi:hypothetical protein
MAALRACSGATDLPIRNLPRYFGSGFVAVRSSVSGLS